MVILDHEFIDEIRLVERATGRTVLPGLVSRLEERLSGFGVQFAECLARGDAKAAADAAHSLTGACRQIGARGLGDLFAAIQNSVKAGQHAEAKRKLEAGASLIAQSIEALKRA